MFSMVFTWIYRLMFAGVGLPGAGFDSSDLSEDNRDPHLSSSIAPPLGGRIMKIIK